MNSPAGEKISNRKGRKGIDAKDAKWAFKRLFDCDFDFIILLYSG